MFFGRSWVEWIAQYETSHQDARNRFCHTLGIPMIVVALAMAVPALFAPKLWYWAAALFVAGWVLQFLGHIFEGKRPEFFNDWRYLFVGLRWWIAKIQRKV